MNDAATPLDDLWDYTDPGASAARFEAFLNRPEVEEDPALHAEATTQLARAQGLMGRFEDAHATLDRIGAEVLETNPRVHIRYLLERGRVYRSSGDAGRAIPLFRQAWEAGSDPAFDYHAVDAAHMLAIALPPAEQADWADQGIKRARKSEDPRARGWLGPLCNNLGWTRHDACQYDEALALFEEALAAFEASGKPKQIRIAQWTIARCLRSLGRFEDALQRQRAVLEAWKAAGETDGYVYEEIGECLLALDRMEEARPYFAEAHEILAKDDWLRKNERARIERLQVLGRPNGE